MATISANTNEKVFQITKWLGVNEAPEGESRLKYGEAAKMRNFKITAGGALRKRQGSKTVAGLMQGYSVVVGGEDKEFLLEENVSDVVYEMYRIAETDSVGKVIAAGSPTSVTHENANECVGFYYNTPDGVFKFKELQYTPEKLVFEDGREYFNHYTEQYTLILGFDAPPKRINGEWDLSKANLYEVRNRANGAYGVKPWDMGQTIYCLMSVVNGRAEVAESHPNISTFSEASCEASKQKLKDSVNHKDEHYYALTKAEGLGGAKKDQYETSKYKWIFNPTSSVSNSAGSVVRGIWSGFVKKREVLCAACNGTLWELSLSDKGEWSKVSCGQIDTSSDVHMFGFDEKLYILCGGKYLCWDGGYLTEVEGYVPIVFTAVSPAGEGTTLEQVNKLTSKRRAKYSPDGTARDFIIPEKGIASIDYAKDVATGNSIKFTADVPNSKVTFDSVPAEGSNTIEIGWSAKKNDAEAVKAMKYSETYNGSQDTRVFVYGDGSNKAFYSGLDENGNARADYFPDLNVANIGDSNTPITAMIRHYNRLLAFKLDSAYSVGYDTITLADGSITPAFYVTSVNKSIGNCAYGQAQLVENRPRTLDGRSIIEWKATSTSGNITGDQRNAERVSQRVHETIRTFDLTAAKTFYDKFGHEYYVIGEDGTALVNNIDADAWYVYTGLGAVCMINYRDELYYGTKDGSLIHLSHDYFSDNGKAIDAYWESGAMSFGADYMRKYSAMVWVGIKPEKGGYLEVSAETDKSGELEKRSFSVDDSVTLPEMNRIKLKAKKFTYYKLSFANNTADKTATIVSADIRVRHTGYVR